MPLFLESNIMATGTGQYKKKGQYKKDNEDWVCYIERIMLFLEANEIEEDS